VDVKGKNGIVGLGCKVTRHRTVTLPDAVIKN
jgi:hypothetical protein